MIRIQLNVELLFGENIKITRMTFIYKDIS